MLFVYKYTSCVPFVYKYTSCVLFNPLKPSGYVLYQTAFEM